MLLKYRARERDLWKECEKKEHERRRILEKIRKEHDTDLFGDSFESFGDGDPGARELKSWHANYMYDMQVSTNFKKLIPEAVPSDGNTSGLYHSSSAGIVDLCYTRADLSNSATKEMQLERAALVKALLLDETSSDDQVKKANSDPDGYAAREREKRVNKVGDQLNKQQKELFDMYLNYFRGEKVANVPPVTLIHGPGGCGKTRAILALDEIAPLFGVKVFKMSFNNINAAAIDGHTTSSTLQMGIQHKKDPGTGHASEQLLPLTLDRHLDFRSLVNEGEKCLVLIDEVSNQAPFHIAKLSYACQRVTEKWDQPFGGIPMAMVGDFSQLGPVKCGFDLPKACVLLALFDQSEHEAKQADPNPEQEEGPLKRRPRHTRSNAPLIQCKSIIQSKQHREKFGKLHPFRVGATLLQKAYFVEMTTQMRSRDLRHSELVERMYKHEMIEAREIRDNYKMLSQNDFAEETRSQECRGNPLGDPDIDRDVSAGWAAAPILVAGNRARVTLTHEQAVNYARATNSVVVRWESLVSNWRYKPSMLHEDKAREDPCFYQYFVQGAVGFLNQTLNKDLRLVNGTEFRFRKLIFENDRDTEMFGEQIADATPGSVITLQTPPALVVVSVVVNHFADSVKEIYRHSFEPCPVRQGQGCTVEAFLIPLTYGTNRGGPKVAQEFTVRGGDFFHPSRVSIAPLFPFDTGFAITFNKAQGRTLRLVILFLGRDPHSPTNRVTYRHLYVALSRVAWSDDIRILANGHDSMVSPLSLEYISDLRPDPELVAFLDGYRGGDLVAVENTMFKTWNATIALARLRDPRI
jgi:hypothetical protein